MSDERRDLWSELKASGKGDGRLEIPSLATGVDSGYGKVRYSLGENGERRLLIPVGKARSGKEVGETGSLKVHVSWLSLTGNSQQFIDLICTDPTLEQVFGELVDDIVARIAAGTESFAAVRGTLDDFRALLFPRRATEVSSDTLLGLLGELYVLSLLARRDECAVDCWVGPMEQRHDFRTKDRAIEVKTTRRSDTTHVTIHGIDQLQPPSDGRLLLIRVTLEPAPDGSIRLEELYRELLAAGVSRQALGERLQEVGCENPLDPAWNAYAFSLDSLTAWEITEGFPRLTGGELKREALDAGVSRIQYVVDLAAAGGHLMGETQLTVWFDEMMA
ncbi:PD-(D/E)XK motif protein [Halomonas elongata]|uniref:PD-(D/E)XK motif protein n=1 Tax=Halomonas elongata (strain ATCC 33173 / DSM 2581 / NBRC 15536 / NCIMB 2198 / 1H9) TaxID=768066 RepID=A0ABZ0T793_HALED|nr:PD-(D/E)XK motif protein [Halomonas elongata]WBF18053.1 PD-(D/E)XK motif protein [Halomonas elongata]WPU46903.1 PD-(D/E)XK motif protein [Halomonas elongata DSM 2581]